MSSGLFSRLASLWRGITNRDGVEAETDEEFRTHIALRADDLERGGLTRDAALQKAHQEFGFRERYRDEVREARSLHYVDSIRFSALDLKLGARMMARYPALTAISALGMAVAIAIATGYSSFARVLLDPTIPLPAGDRIVALENWDVKIGRRGETNGADIAQWRADMKSVRDIGAWRNTTLNVVAASGEAEPVPVAEMTASGFRVAGTKAALGRFLLESDEAPGAPPAVVLSHRTWTQQFASDSGIVGRQIRLGTVMRTVVGVMPEDFAFPVNHHFWIPLAISSTMRPGGARLSPFGTLVTGATLASARAELDLIGKRAAATLPESHATLQAQVHPFSYPLMGMDQPSDVETAGAMPVLTTLLLVIVCINVAILIYARTALREGEIAVRTALGASRRRVIMQLFAESLVISLISAGVGLAIGGYALSRINDLLTLASGTLPFWFRLSLSPTAVIYAVALAVLAALITGVIPALKVTGAAPHSTLQQLSAGSGSSRLGRGWTVLIVAQIAVAVALLPVAVYQGRSMFRYGTTDPGFDAARFVSADLAMEPQPDTGFDATYTRRALELARRLGEQGEVAATTFATSEPGQERDERIQDDSLRVKNARFAAVDPGYMTVFGVPRVLGRDFTNADAESSAKTVIVNQSFAKRFFGSDGAALGRRVREVSTPPGGTDRDELITGPWFEIVGVVSDFPAPMIPEQEEAKFYRASMPGPMYPASISVRLRESKVTDIDRRLRQAAFAVDPTMQIVETRVLAAKYEDDRSVFRMIAYAIAIVMGSVMLLSAAGIYAMLSLAVTRRRREIAIRAALGAGARQILSRILVRAARPVIAGVITGLVIVATVDQMALHGELLRDLPLIATVISVVAAVAVFSALEPARRGMRIEPSEALKQE